MDEIIMADKHPNNNLKRSIGFGSAISIVIGTIIGWGVKTMK